jgi:hypothetical protein
MNLPVRRFRAFANVGARAINRGLKVGAEQALSLVALSAEVFPDIVRKQWAGRNSREESNDYDGKFINRGVCK